MSQAFLFSRSSLFWKNFKWQDSDWWEQRHSCYFVVCWWCLLQSKCDFVPFRKRVRVHQKSFVRWILFIPKVDNGILTGVVFFSGTALEMRNRQPVLNYPFFYLPECVLIWIFYCTRHNIAINYTTRTHTMYLRHFCERRTNMQFFFVSFEAKFVAHPKMHITRWMMTNLSTRHFGRTSTNFDQQRNSEIQVWLLFVD